MTTAHQADGPTDGAPATPVTAPRRPASARPWWRRAVLAAVAVTVLAGGPWRFYTTRPGVRLARGEEAVRNRDWKTATDLAARLESTGHPDEAHWLRAQAFYGR